MALCFFRWSQDGTWRARRMGKRLDEDVSLLRSASCSKSGPKEQNRDMRRKGVWPLVSRGYAANLSVRQISRFSAHWL